MIVPDVLTPVAFDKYANDFIYTLENFILRINYQEEVFEVQTPNQIAYNEDFDFIKSPPDWFEVIEFGLVEWVRKAINWNTTKSMPKDQSKPFSFKVEGVTYTGMFNERTNDLTLNIPGRTIICNRESITTDFPELQYAEHGQLISIISSIAIGNMLKCKTEPSSKNKIATPIVFNPKPIVIGDNTYEFDHLTELDLVLIKEPDCAIHTNMLTIELDAPELAVLHQEMLIDVIRDVVYREDQISKRLELWGN